MCQSPKHTASALDLGDIFSDCDFCVLRSKALVDQDQGFLYSTPVKLLTNTYIIRWRKAESTHTHKISLLLGQ